MVTIVVTRVFEVWALGLDQSDRKAVARVVGLLEARGVALGYPFSSAIRGSGIGLRELRIQSNGKPIRIFYKFDPRRQAVLLTGADKTGKKRFYLEKIREAEQLWIEYLEDIKHAED